MSDTTDPADKSPAELEREVEMTRRGVSETLDTLRAKLRPSQMMDEVAGDAMAWLRGSGGVDFARNLGATMRDNPLPVLLIGAGVAWLMLGGSSSAARADTAPRRNVAHAGGHVRSYPPGTTRVRAYGGETAAAPAGSEQPGAIRRAYESAAGAVSDAARTVSATASSLVEKGSEQVEGLRDEADHVARRAASQVREMEPFLYGALGLAIGAGVAALLPATEMQDRLFGEHREAAMRAAREGLDTVRHMAEDKIAEAKDEIVETYETAVERLDKEGLAQAPRIIGDAASRVGEVASETVRSATDEAKRNITG